MANDTDNVAGLVAGILIAGEARRKADEQASEAQRQREENAELAKEADAAKRRADKIARKAREDHEDALDDLQSLREQFLQLLGLPLKDIAARSPNLNPAFKVNYDALMLDMADWVLSQKANRELAIRLGTRLGMTVEEVTEMAREIRQDVLNDRNPAENETNAGASALLTAHKTGLEQLAVSREESVHNRYQSLLASGDIYDLLEKPPKHSASAVMVWKRLASEGIREAQLNLGFAYRAAFGVIYDATKSDEWLQKALAQGEPRAAYQLYELYSKSYNPNRDPRKAERYLEQALALNDSRAAAARADLEQKRAQQRAAREQEARQRQWDDEAPALLKQLLVIREGDYPKEVLDRIEERNYEWFTAVKEQHLVVLTFTSHGSENTGSWFSPAWTAWFGCTASISTAEDKPSYVSFKMGFGESKKLVSGSCSRTKPGRFAFGAHPVGTTIEKFRLLRHVFRGYGTPSLELEFTYIPRKPAVVERNK